MCCMHGDDPISSYILCLVPSYFRKCNHDDIDLICMIYMYKQSRNQFELILVLASKLCLPLLTLSIGLKIIGVVINVC